MNPQGDPPATNMPPEFLISPEPPETRFLKWVLFGAHGVRVGWSAAGFVFLYFLFSGILQTISLLAIAQPLHASLGDFSPYSALLMEAIQVLTIFGAVAVCALIEQRRIVDYYLAGPRRPRHFFIGLASGIAALSVLVAALHAGGWLQIGPASLNPSLVFRFGVIWGAVFLLTGLAEEGSTRCYLLFTLTRGMNFWWALGSVGAVCLLPQLNSSSNGAAGVYWMALLGLLPCLVLDLKKSASAGFWQATWFTSTLFGYIHTFNNGESSIGIFAAASIGVVFCVSIRLTGSAWWAIGFHAAWDWAQTFLYGTADSGLAPQGHYLSSTPVGAVLWSGGNDGPEGSLLAIPIILLTLAVLILVYGRRRSAPESPSTTAQPQLS